MNGSRLTQVSRKLKFPPPVESGGINERLENAIGGDFDDSEYHRFQSGIERINGKAPCNSTMIAGILKPRNAGSGVTPVKLPRTRVGTPSSPRISKYHLRARAVKGKPSFAPPSHRLL